VQRVEVVGAAQVDPAQIEQAVGLQGKSMLHLDLSAAQASAASFPLVQSVRIERRWPQTVRVLVSERQPVAYWQVGQDRYPVDPEGVVLGEVAPPEGAPVITDLSNPVRLIPGDRVDRDAVSLARQLSTRVPGTLGAGVASWEYSVDRGLALVTAEGYRVIVGDSQDVEYKLAVWKAITEQLGPEAIAGHELDLRFRDKPALSRLGAAAPPDQEGAP
jgi:cell division protein FtsQ